MKLLGILCLQMALASSAMAALVVTNSGMTNDSTGPGTSANGTMFGWSNNVTGGLEAKSTEVPNFFGALVQSGGAAGTVGETDNDWTDVPEGSVLILKFDLFNERLADGNAANDILAELLIDGVAKSSLSLLRADEEYDDTTGRTTYRVPGYAVAAEDIGKQVDVRFTATAADTAWHQTGIDNVEIIVDNDPSSDLQEIELTPARSYPAPEDRTVISSAPIDTLVGTLTTLTILGVEAEGLTYSLVAGDGDDNNASYSLGGDDGNELRVAAALTGTDGPQTVRIRAAKDAESLEMAVTFTVLADTDEDGLFDAWETNFGTLADFSNGGDQDTDGVEDQDEFTLGTSPIATDSDEDGISDGQEIIDETDPLDPLSFLRPPLTVLNGTLFNTGIGQIPDWLNTGTLNLEGKTDVNGLNDNFGALVFEGGQNGSTAATNNNWTGVRIGEELTLKFELFNERLADGNGTTDILAELLVDGAVKSSLELLRADEVFDDTDIRTPYAAPSYAVTADDIGKQVDVRFTATAADAGWHQTGIDNVSLERGAPDPTGGLLITEVTQTENGPMIRFKTEAGATYLIFRSVDLVTWVEVGDDVPAGGATGEPTEFTDPLFNIDFPDGAEKIFYRIQRTP